MLITMKRRGKLLKQRWLNDVILLYTNRKGKRKEIFKSSWKR